MSHALGGRPSQALCDHVVTQAREYGLIRDRLRLKDATHVLANIAVPSTLRLVVQTRQRLLDAARRMLRRGWRLTKPRRRWCGRRRRTSPIQTGWSPV